MLKVNVGRGEIMENPKAVCDGGDLDCGSGLLLIIKKAMDPLFRWRSFRSSKSRADRC